MILVSMEEPERSEAIAQAKELAEKVRCAELVNSSPEVRVDKEAFARKVIERDALKDLVAKERLGDWLTCDSNEDLGEVLTGLVKDNEFRANPPVNQALKDVLSMLDSLESAVDMVIERTEPVRVRTPKAAVPVKWEEEIQIVNPKLTCALEFEIRVAEKRIRSLVDRLEDLRYELCV